MRAKKRRTSPKARGSRSVKGPKIHFQCVAHASTNLVDERLGLGQIVHARVLLRGDSASIVFALGLDRSDLEETFIHRETNKVECC